MSTVECPKSYITGDSRAWLEQFQVWRRLGYPDVEEMPVRDALALLVLQQEERAETQSGAARGGERGGKRR